MKPSLYETLTTPIQILFGQRIGATRRISMRPFTLLAIPIATIALVCLAASMLFTPEDRVAERQKIATLQHEQTRITGKLSEAEALLLLRDGQIASMQQEMESSRRNMQAMQQRLDMFDEVLAARKVRGVHVLHPMAQWRNGGGIEYQLTLVKGENYPRWIKGNISFTALSPTGIQIKLQDKKGRSSFKLEMTTHAFIEGLLVWQQKWQPDAIAVTLIDHKGRQKAHMQIPVIQPGNGTAMKENQDD